MPIKFLLLGGGFWVFLEGGGGWKCQFYFYGRGDFSSFCTGFFKGFPSERRIYESTLVRQTNCSHDMSQKVERLRRLSEQCKIAATDIADFVQGNSFNFRYFTSHRCDTTPVLSILI